MVKEINNMSLEEIRLELEIMLYKIQREQGYNTIDIPIGEDYENSTAEQKYLYSLYSELERRGYTMSTETHIVLEKKEKVINGEQTKA